MLNTLFGLDVNLLGNPSLLLAHDVSVVPHCFGSQIVLLRKLIKLIIR